MCLQAHEKVIYAVVSMRQSYAFILLFIIHAVREAVKEDQWDRCPGGYSPPLAFPPHIPPQGGGGLYLGLQVGFLKFT